MNRVLFTILTCFLLATTAWADCARLRELTPEGAGVYGEVEGVKDSWQKLSEGELARRAQEFPPVARWKAISLPAVKFLVGQISGQLGLEPQQLQHEVFGGSVLLAMWPEERNGEWDGGGLLLVDAPNAALLQAAVDGFNVASQRAKELQSLEKLTHSGSTYHVRHMRRNGKDSTEFIAVMGNIGVLTNRKSLMLRVLELHAQGTAPAGSIAAAPWYTVALSQVHPQASVRLVLNPRPWSPMVLASLKKGMEEDPKSKPVAEAAQHLFESLDFAAASLDVSDGLGFQASVRFDSEKLGPLWAARLDAWGGEVAALDFVPRQALVVLAGRLDPAPLVEGMMPLLEEKELDDAKKLAAVAGAVTGGWKFWQEVVPNLGPNWASFLVPSTTSQPGEIPVDWVTVLQVREPAPADPTIAPLPVVMRNTLKMVMNVIAVAHNAEHAGRIATVKSIEKDGLHFSFIEGLSDLPANVVPSLTLSQGYLFLGTSREAIKHMARLSASDSLPQHSPWPRLFPASWKRPSHVAYFNLQATRTFLHDHRAQLIPALAAQKKVEPAQVERSLGQLQSILQLADYLSLADKVDAQGISISVRWLTEK